MSEQAIAAHRGALKRQTIARAIRMRHIYLLLLLSLTLLVVFKYGPIYGLIIAFKATTSTTACSAARGTTSLTSGACSRTRSSCACSSTPSG